MKNSRYAKGVLGFSIVGTVLVVATADVFNSTHLFNPDWPAHARFHIAMQFTALVLVSAVSLWALSGPLSWQKALLATVAPITFWPGLLVAWLVPGTNAYATAKLEEIGIPFNIFLALIFIAITLGGLWLARPQGRRSASRSASR